MADLAVMSEIELLYTLITGQGDGVYFRCVIGSNPGDERRINISNLKSFIESIGGAGVINRDQFSPTAGQTIFMLSHDVNPAVKPIIFVNGIQAEVNTDYVFDLHSVTWLDNNFTLDTNDSFTIYY